MQAVRHPTRLHALTAARCFAAERGEHGQRRQARAHSAARGILQRERGPQVHHELAHDVNSGEHCSARTPSKMATVCTSVRPFTLGLLLARAAILVEGQNLLNKRILCYIDLSCHWRPREAPNTDRRRTSCLCWCCCTQGGRGKGTKLQSTLVEELQAKASWPSAE